MTSANTNFRVIHVDGAQLYADVRSGTAPALVFLHYWGGSRRTWRSVLNRLDPDQAFVNYDQRGWGDSANAPGPYDVQRLADDAQSVIMSRATMTVLANTGHLSPLDVPDQVASHITTFTAQLNELPHADKGKPQRRLATCRRRGEGRFRTQHLDAGSATPD